MTKVQERTPYRRDRVHSSASIHRYRFVFCLLLGFVYGISFLRKYTTQTHMSYGLQWLEKDSTAEKKIYINFIELQTDRKKNHHNNNSTETICWAENDTNISLIVVFGLTQIIPQQSIHLSWIGAIICVSLVEVTSTESNRIESKCCT